MLTAVKHWYKPKKTPRRKRSRTENGDDRNGQMFRRVYRDGEDPLLVSDDFHICPGTLRKHLQRTQVKLMDLLSLEDNLRVPLSVFFTEFASGDIGCGLHVEDLPWLVKHLRAEQNKLQERQLQKQQP